MGVTAEQVGMSEITPEVMRQFKNHKSVLLETRKTIADWSLKEAGLVTDKVMSMATEKEVTDYLSDYLSERNKK